MTPIVRCALTFGLAILAAMFAPRHACHLSSVLLMIPIVLICFVLLPVLAYFAQRPRFMWPIIVASPVLTYFAMEFYMEVLHWEHFPAWLLSSGP